MQCMKLSHWPSHIWPHLQRTRCLHGSNTTLISPSKQILHNTFSWYTQDMNKKLVKWNLIMNLNTAVTDNNQKLNFNRMNGLESILMWIHYHIIVAPLLWFSNDSILNYYDHNQFIFPLYSLETLINNI